MKNENKYPKILVLGDGLLGSEVIKQTGWEHLSHSKNNIDVVNDFDGLTTLINNIDPDIIVNCIGYTNTYCDDKQKHWDINYGFVANLVDFCDSNIIKLVHISTDYIYANSTNINREIDIPVHQETWYSYSKLLSDGYVQLRLKDYLLIRCSFKPKPFPYEKAYENIKGNFDYVDVIAKQIIKLIRENQNGIWNIGTELKTIFDLAIQTKSDVEEAYSLNLPTISMSLYKFNNRK